MAADVDPLRGVDVRDDINDPPVRVGEVHDPSVARFVERFDRDARFRSEPVQVRARRLERQAEERRLTEMGHVDVMIGVGAAHVQRGVGAKRGVHAERLQEALHLVQVRRLEARKRHVVHADDRTGHGSIVR